MPNEKKKPSKETLEILNLYDKGLKAKEIAQRLHLPEPSVRARKAWRTMRRYDLEATGPNMESPRSEAAGKQSPHYREKTDEQVVEDLFSDDISAETTREKRQVIRSVLKRNEKAVASLKKLYRGECQLTGKKYVFRKTDGRLYCEAHHLIPLGEGGADSPHNLIIISPLIHRMFHYAEVSGLDLVRIVDNKLEIKINTEPFTITWHPKHAELVAAVKSGGKK